MGDAADGAVLALGPGERIELPPGDAVLQPGQPGAGDLTLVLPGPDGGRIVLPGLLALIDGDGVVLQLGPLELDTLAELLEAAESGAGNGKGGDPPLSGSGLSVGEYETAQFVTSISRPMLLDADQDGSDAADRSTLLEEASADNPFRPEDDPASTGTSDDGTPPVTNTPPGTPILTTMPASGLEDTVIALDIQAGVLGATDGLNVLISGVPAGVMLNAGTALGGGLWRLTPAELAGLSITLPANEDASFNLTVTVASTYGGAQRIASGSLPVTVIPVIDRLFTAGDDMVDLSVLADLTAPSANAPWAEDGNRADALDGDDVVTLASTGPNALAAGTTFLGGAGDDTITGGSLDDVIAGGAGDDVLSGNDGNDTLLSGAGTDSLDGGMGVNWASYADSAGGVTVDLAAGTAAKPVGSDVLANIRHVLGSGFADSLSGDGNANTLTGAGGADTIHGAGGADTLSGSAGDDTLDGGTGSDLLTGGAGNDRLVTAGDATDYLSFQGAITDYSFAMAGSDLVIADLVAGRDGTDTVAGIGAQAPGFHHALFPGFDFLIDAFGASPVNHVVPFGGNRIGIGNTGNDTIFYFFSAIHLIDGGDGNDTLGGANNVDYLFGGGGDDLFGYSGGNFVAGETVDGGAGSDTINFSSGSNDCSIGTVRSIEALAFSSFGATATFAGAQVGGGQLAANLAVTGNAGADALIFNQATGGVLDLSAFALTSWTGGTDSVQVNGSTGAETLTGTGQADTISGNAGDDVLKGLVGNDTLDGGNGTDTVVFAGNAADYSFTSGTSYLQVVDAAAGRDGTDGVANVELLRFADGDVALMVGDAGANVLTGAGGNDLLFGLGGNDTLTGNAGDDTLDGGTGTDTLTGGAGDDRLLVGSDAGDKSIFQGAITEYSFAMVGTDLVITDLVGGRDGTDTIIAIGGAAANVNHLATFAGVPFIIAAIGASPGIQAPIFSSILGVGNTGDDTILASSSSNSLLNLIDGGSGNDLLGGGRQTDYLFGGNGDDTFIYYGGGQFVAGETVDGGAGSDTLLFSAANDDFSTGAVRSIEAIAFDGLGGTASFAGSQVGAGLLVANSSVTGGASTDTLTFNAAAGTSLDLSGFSFASWTNGTDSFQINGSTGAETLTGTGQNDTVTGGAGNDTIDGGAGADTFRYTSTGDGFDSILGFDGDGADQDVLDLDKLFDALGIATAARAARVQITDTSGGSDGPVWLIEVDTDGNGDFDLAVATIASTDAITVNQDVLVGSI